MQIAAEMSLRERIQSRHYDNLDPRAVQPERPSPPKTGATPEEYRAFADLLAAFNAAQEPYEVACRAWRKKQADLWDQFRRDLLEDLGIAEHPKADTLWGIAYERGHSGGLGDVLSNAEELVPLLT